jgi:chemotaxis receptor (MCP) glutamine deamidase CheD
MTQSRISYDKPSLPPAVEVAWDDFGKGTRLDTLITSGIGPCIGLAVYEPETKRGYLGHADMYSSSNVFGEMLKNIIEGGSDVNKLRCWLRGGVPILESPKSTTVFRERVIARVLSSGIKEENISIEWNEDEDVILNMELDCRKGEVRLAEIYAENDTEDLPSIPYAGDLWF